MAGLGALGLGRVGTRAVIGLTTVLCVGAAGWLVSPALAQGRSTPTSISAAAAASTASPSAVIGDPLTSGATAQSSPVTPFEMSYGKGPRHDYLAYLPAERTSDMAVVLVHGGGWTAGSAEDTQPYNQRLYDAGVASFSIDYRYATDAAWPAQRTDLEDALAAIRKDALRWHIDPAKIALVGVSAGGHLALDLASGPGTAETCGVVSYSGPTSMDLLLADRGMGFKQRRLARAVKELAPSKKVRADASLPRTPSGSDAPALLYAAQYDWVDHMNSVDYAQAYAGTGLDVQSVVLAGQRQHASGYALTDPQVWTGTMAFLRRHCA